MSDCMNGGRFSYDAQTHVKPRQANMRKLGEPPYEIEMPDTWIIPSEITELVDAITWRGQRFVRERTCGVLHIMNEYDHSISEWDHDECSNCGAWIGEHVTYCPSCGRRTEYAPERTCKLEHVKSGPRYDVWRYTCCGYEHAESVSEDSVAENYCPKCGAHVNA